MSYNVTLIIKDLESSPMCSDLIVKMAFSGGSCIMILWSDVVEPREVNNMFRNSLTNERKEYLHNV